MDLLNVLKQQEKFAKRTFMHQNQLFIEKKNLIKIKHRPWIH